MLYFGRHEFLWNDKIQVHYLTARDCLTYIL